ncbi:hypothetical protein A2U01_0026510, partial [Trifolium medium]|nr:hypothetical protein [Trifolium medium]
MTGYCGRWTVSYNKEFQSSKHDATVTTNATQ